MGLRGLSVLRLAALPINSGERDALWRQLCDERSEAATRALIRDYARRGILTSKDLQTAQLTKAGMTRRDAGEKIQRERAK